ncbi:MAG: RidA family protein [Gammaproteobacteria bacterium]|nr:RidA family protein [Gammaproteobacteria bacterium]
MSKKVIATPAAPKAIGTYSQAIRVGDTVYLSGQIPLVPETMELESGDMRAQITRVFENLKAVARAAGSDLSDIVKLNVYLTDLANFPLVNEVMAQYFPEPYPARAAVGVAALPKGVPVEMDAVLVSAARSAPTAKRKAKAKSKSVKAKKKSKKR